MDNIKIPTSNSGRNTLEVAEVSDHDNCLSLISESDYYGNDTWVSLNKQETEYLIKVLTEQLPKFK